MYFFLGPFAYARIRHQGEKDEGVFTSMFHLSSVLATSNDRLSSAQINRHDSESNALRWTIALKANSDMLL